MSISDRSLKEFIFTAKCGDLIHDTKARDRWHRLARRVVRVLGEHMGLERSEYDMRTDKGGSEFVPGVTILHSQTLYVRLEISGFARDIGFMYKRCNGRKDIIGASCQYMKWESLLNMEDVATRLLQHGRGD